MKAKLLEFGLRMRCDWVTPSKQSFRPPSWPPPRDWVVSEDADGAILSRYGDPYWDLSPWAGKKSRLDFCDGPTKGKKKVELDADNADLLRVIAALLIWGPNGAAAVNSLKSRFLAIRRVVTHCSKHGIHAADLMRFPRVIDELAKKVPRSEYDLTIVVFHRLWDSREITGFTILTPAGIKRLAALKPPARDIVQTAYIPPRIWKYQLERLRSCIDDFLRYQQQIEDCFNYCLGAYIHNFGSIEKALSTRGQWTGHLKPFGLRKKKSRKYKYLGRFELTAEQFGIRELMERWLGVKRRGLEVRSFSAYLSLVQSAGLAYIANFTIQRVTEAASLRTDCLVWDTDAKLGRIPLICGETTKTDPDSDARWPTSPSVEVAVRAMTSIARLRIQCAAATPESQPRESDLRNPYLFDRAFEPWSGNEVQGYGLRPNIPAYQAHFQRSPCLFDENQLRITEEDLKIACMLTPNLTSKEEFAVGKVWPIAWHQLRRTGAVNMFASGLLSDSSMQFLMKHRSRLMPLYYGRGYSKLRFNTEVETALLSAMYEVIAHNLHAAMSERFVSPLGEDRKAAIVVNLVGDKDLKALSAAGRKGQTAFREIRLGACTKRTTCTYGGIESVARCAGGDGDGPCADALFDRERVPAIEADLAGLELQMEQVPEGSPRHRSLAAERIGMENFLNVTRTD